MSWSCERSSLLVLLGTKIDEENESGQTKTWRKGPIPGQTGSYTRQHGGSPVCFIHYHSGGLLPMPRLSPRLACQHAQAVLRSLDTARCRRAPLSHLRALCPHPACISTFPNSESNCARNQQENLERCAAPRTELPCQHRRIHTVTPDASQGHPTVRRTHLIRNATTQNGQQAWDPWSRALH